MNILLQRGNIRASVIDIRLEKLLETFDIVETSSIEEKLEIHRVIQNEFISSGHLYECPVYCRECDDEQMKMQFQCLDCVATFDVGSETKNESNCRIM
ncbi:14227_t:CDS:2 [Funneliformis mosseae]|uniref:14227_t:CDS:1 n=1 Tax=Funneliformis mosseae TaxID=27381 RepID=A0A9N9EHQ2_FUNMO|nr:14227_t:CDS:2 [Funneliformis mosseae]